MAALERTHEGISPAWSLLPDPRRMVMRYLKRDDTLVLVLTPPRPAESVDVDGAFWVRVIPTTGQTVGVEVEDFCSVFLPNHPELRPLWDSRPATQGRDGSHSPEARRFVAQFVHYFNRLLEQGVPV